MTFSQGIQKSKKFWPQTFVSGGKKTFKQGEQKGTYRHTDVQTDIATYWMNRPRRPIQWKSGLYLEPFRRERVLKATEEEEDSVTQLIMTALLQQPLAKPQGLLKANLKVNLKIIQKLKKSKKIIGNNYNIKNQVEPGFKGHPIEFMVYCFWIKLKHVIGPFWNWIRYFSTLLDHFRQSWTI